MVVVKGDVYYSDSDSDDDDVDRYVFLARQSAPAPAPAAGDHAEDDRGTSSENDGGDDGGDATADEGESDRGGGRMRKRRPLGREILDDAPPPPPPAKKKKKARVELIAPPLAQTPTSPPSGSGSETESDSAPSSCGVRDGESGSDGSHGTKAHDHRRAPGREGEAMNPIKKRRDACGGGKRRRGPGSEEDGDRAVTAAAAAKADAPPAATSRRFVCSLCEKCFDCYQALGGHVLGHRKKAKIAIGTAACLDDADDGDGAGACTEEEAAVVVEANEETDRSISLRVHKMAAAAARLGKANGGGGCDGKIKTVDDVAEHREDVNGGGHDDANGDANFRNKGNAIAASGKGFTRGGNCRSNGKTDIGAAISNGDGNAGKTLTLYRCKVCGKECPTGRALGGHMRKHRKQPPLAAGGEGRSPSPPTDDDCQIPLARMFRAETGLQLQRENKIGWV